MKQRTKPKESLILWLALKDMFHEKIITINLILGTAAIIAPLLILFGIKFGIIETMSNRLVNDPKNLEIRPISSQSFTMSWFDEVIKNDKIDFIIPMTRQLSSSAQIKSLEPSAKMVVADIFATNFGDPLILKNGGLIPDINSCVINDSLAKDTGLKEGDSLQCSVTRYVKNKIQKASIRLKVIAVLSPRAGFIKSIYVPLEVVENIEKYKDGLSVSQWGWKGNISEAYSIYDGVFIALPKPLNRAEQIRLLSGTGFAYINEIACSAAEKKAGYTFSDKDNLYFIKPAKNSSINDENIGSLKIKLRGKKAKLFPWAEVVNAVLDNNTSIKILALPSSMKNIKSMTLYTNKITKDKTILKVLSKQKELMLPLNILKLDINSTYYFMKAESIGKLALLKQRNLMYDNNIKKILLARKGYASFRIYAKTLQDVEPLKNFFENKGINVSTKTERIHEVQKLDKYLTLVFWLIAIVGVFGGATTLSASLYSSVERKRKELSILRLLGLSGGMIFRFPIYQGTFISISGVSIALIFFIIMSTIINELFQTHLQNGESFCTLTAIHILMVYSIAVFLAIVSSMIAAYQATKMDPAEAMRNE